MKSTLKYLLLFQQDFQMAISSWLETGVCQKMENDIKTSPSWRGHFDETAFWTRRIKYGNKPLTIEHVLPSIMVLSLGLTPSIIIFLLELLLFMKKRKASIQSFSNIHSFALSHLVKWLKFSNAIVQLQDNIKNVLDRLDPSLQCKY